MIRARATAALAQALAAPDQVRDGRWLVYGGGVMVPHLFGINGDEPARIVVELSSLVIPPGRRVALADHSTYQVLGAWDGIAIEATGLTADLHLTRPATPDEAGPLSDVVRYAAHLRNGVPLQTSIGISCAAPELIRAGASVEVNGQTYRGDGELPLYVFRGAILDEISLVTFGADDTTRRIAATRTEPTPTSAKATAMSDEPTTDDTKPDAMATMAAALGEVAKTCTAIMAKLSEISVPPPATTDDDKKKDGEAAAAAAAAAAASTTRGVTFASGAQGTPGAAGAPASIAEAMIQVRAAKPHLTGSGVRAEAERLYPALRLDTPIPRPGKV
jgi:hypothetical protein